MKSKDFCCDPRIKILSSWLITPRNQPEAEGNGVGDVSLKKFKFAARLLHVIERDTRGDGVGDGSPLAF